MENLSSFVNEEIGLLVRRFFDQAQQIQINREPDGALIVLVEARGSRSSFKGSSLLDALRVMLRAGTRKECAACGKAKYLAEFSHNAAEPDGRNRRCLVCERERVKAYKEKQQNRIKRLEKKQGRAPKRAV